MNKEDKLRIVGALHNEARRLERVARHRGNSGPRLAGYRAGLRAEVDLLDKLADGIRSGQVEV